jgi:protein-tyrosine phosphatase
VILAHPERMRAVQDEPELADYFKERGVLLQGNLQCFSDAPTARTRQIVERFLSEDRYFMLGSDLHSFETLPPRLAGLKRAIELAGAEKIDVLTKTNPAKLLPES